MRLFALFLALFIAFFISTGSLYAGTITIQDGTGTSQGPVLYDDAYIEQYLTITGSLTIDTLAGVGPNDIIVESEVEINWTSVNSLTLEAVENITITGRIQHDGPVDGSGGVALLAGGDVQLGVATQPFSVMVGSRYGLTRVAGRNVRLQGGNASGPGRFAQVGFYAIDQGPTYTVTGPISVTAVLTIEASAGMSVANYVQIGHGGTRTSINRTVDGNSAGNIALAAGEDIAFSGGSANMCYTQVGNGGVNTHGNHSGDHSLHAGGSIVFTAGSGFVTYAQVGNGGRDDDGNHSGDHALYAGGNIAFTAGNDDWNSYAQAGNGGFNSTGSHSGSHTLSVGGNITFIGGDSFDAVGNYVQVGNGGVTTHGNQSGDHSLHAGGSIEFTSGNGFYDYAQAGNGGALTQGNHSGNQTLNAGGSIAFTSGSGFLAYAQIGNGAASQVVTGTRSGNITVLTGADLVLTGARIGHRSSDGAAAILSGDTVIGVSQNNPFALGSGEIRASDTMTFETVFNSATMTNSGKLRFYVPGGDNVFIPNGTAMNTESFPGSVPPERLAGFFLFDDGPYILGADYAFYFAPPPDVGVAKQVEPSGVLLPGQPLTYTLAFSNTGTVSATNVILTDTLPGLLTNVTIDSQPDPSVTITPIGSAPNLAWEISDLDVGEGGQIIIRGVVSPTLTVNAVMTNSAGITATADVTLANNVASVVSNVVVPEVQFDPVVYEVMENVGHAAVNVVLDTPNPHAAVTVAYASSDDSAEAGSDYSQVNGTLTITPGFSSATIAIPILDDAIVEADELFTVTLSSPSGARFGTEQEAQVTIHDDDSVISIAVGDADKLEGDSGTTSFTFTVNRTGNTSVAASVQYAVSGSEVDGADFVLGSLPSGTVNFGAGDASETITVDVQGDLQLEADESFIVTLSNPSTNAIINVATASGTIRNDDSTFSIAAVDADKPEGDSGTTSFTFTVNRTGYLLSNASVDFDVSGNANGTDFTGGVLPSGTFNFTGEASQVLTLDVQGDGVVELDEPFTVTLSDPSANATIATAAAAGNIRNDDSASLIIDDPSDLEGNSGTKPFTLTVTLNGAVDGQVTVDFATVEGSAEEGVDFVAAADTLTFAGNNGETQSVVVQVNGDSDLEGDETLTVMLDNPDAQGRAVSLADDTGIATIDNDDNESSIAPLDADKAEGDSGATPFTFTVSRTGYITDMATVEYAVSGVVEGVDFVGGVLPSGVLNFGIGETSQTLTLNVQGDTVLEVDEPFTVTLSNPSPNATSATATGNIRNDDSVSLAIDDTHGFEGNSGTTLLTLTVTLNGNAGGAVDVDFATIPGSAEDGVDYQSTSGMLTFAGSNGETEIIVVQVNGDTDLEADETLTVTLDNVQTQGPPISLADDSGVVTIDNDDSEFTVDALNADNPEGNNGTTPFTFVISRTGFITEAASVGYAVTGGAANGADFAGGVLPSGTLDFAEGQAEATLILDVQGDAQLEADEPFTVTFSSSSGATLVTEAAAGVIRNDDSVISITASDADNLEGDSGSTSFTFAVNRAGYANAPANVSYAVSGAAVNGADFAGGTLPSGTIDFDASESATTLVVNVQGDLLVEGDEAFAVTLSNSSSNTTIGTALANGVIRNDDEAAALSVSKHASVTLARVGEEITYTYFVTNSGGIAFTVVSAVDDPLGTVPLNASSLAPGVSTTGELVHTVTLEEWPGPLENTVTVTGTPAVGDPLVVTAQESVDVVNAAFAFTKTVGVQGIEPECTASATIQVPISTTVVYCFTIENTGPETLTTHTLVDSQLGTVLDGELFEVAPGASFSISVTRQIFASITNTAEWTAGYAGSDTVQVAALPTQANAEARVNISGDDNDQDEDGIPDNVEQAGDEDSDNDPNFLDNDSDGDGQPDEDECPSLPCRDFNDDGEPDFLDLDNPTALEPGEQPAAPGWLFLPRIGQ